MALLQNSFFGLNVGTCLWHVRLVVRNLVQHAKGMSLQISYSATPIYSARTPETRRWIEAKDHSPVCTRTAAQ